MKQRNSLKKNTLVIVITMMMLMGVMMGAALPVQADQPVLFIGDGIDPKGYVMVMSYEDSVSGSGDSGTWAYQHSSNGNTLTLTNYKYNGLGIDAGNDNKMAIFYQGDQPLTIELKGENEISFTGSHGIYSSSGSSPVTIQGDGSLKVSGNGLPICTNKDLTIQNGRIEATSTNESDAAITSSYDINIKGGDLTATGQYAGIKAYGNMIVSGGSVKAAGNNGPGIRLGTGSQDDGTMKVTGGKVFAEGKGENGEFGDAGYGLFCLNSIEIEISEGAALIAKGTVSASFSATFDEITYGKVKNSVPGIGWDDLEGNGEGTAINISSAGQVLPYKMFVFPSSAIGKVKTPAEAKSLTYTGSQQTLVTSGLAEAGTMQYAIGEDATTVPKEGWSESLPKGTDAKTYYVWYKAKGSFRDSKPAVIKVTIARRDVTVAAKDQTIKEGGEISKGTDQAMLYGGGKGHKLSSVTLTANRTTRKIIPSNARIKNGSGADVTGNYHIKFYSPGTLTLVSSNSNTGKSKPAKPVIMAILKSTGKSSLRLTWTKRKKAAGYDIYISRCGRGLKLFKSVSAKEGRKVDFRNLKRGIPYKARVKPYIMDGNKKKYVNPSPIVHALTNQGNHTYTNVKAVTVKKTSFKLKVRSKAKIKASMELYAPDKKTLTHTLSMRYKSSNPSVASVSKKGKITAKGKGDCKIYCVAINGVHKIVHVKVQ